MLIYSHFIIALKYYEDIYLFFIGVLKLEHILKIGQLGIKQCKSFKRNKKKQGLLRVK